MSSQGGVDFSKRISRRRRGGGKLNEKLWKLFVNRSQDWVGRGGSLWIVCKLLTLTGRHVIERRRVGGRRRRCVERHSSGCMIDRTRDKLEDWKWEIVWNAKRWRRWKISNWSIGVWWEGSDRGISWKIGKSRDVVENAAQRAHKAADERVYGVVTRAATENGPGKSQDA